MARVDLGGDVRTSGQGDVYLSGVVDLDIWMGPDGPVVLAATQSGGAGLASYAVGAGGLARTGFGLWPDGALIGQTPELFRFQSGAAEVLAVTGVSTAGPWVYDLTAAGAVSLQGSLPAGETLPPELVDLQVMQPGGDLRFLFGIKEGRARIVSWQIGADGSLSDLRDQGSDLNAADNGITGLLALPDRDQPLLLTLTGGADILASFAVGTKAKITLADRHTQDMGLGIADPSGLKAVSVAGQDYVIVAGRGSSTLSVFHVDAAGMLTPTDHLLDSPNTRFGHVAHLEVVELDGAAYVLAAGDEHGITLFQMLPGGRLLHLSTLADGLDSTLADVSAVALAALDGALGVAVSSATEPGLTWIEARPGPQGVTWVGSPASEQQAGTTGDDILAGLDGDDSLDGGDGDDILMDGAGADTLRGGAGADVFVLTADGALDEIVDFQPGQDRLDLSNWAFLRNTGQLGILDLSGGRVQLAFGTEILRITPMAGFTLSAAQVRGWDVLDGDRMLASWQATQIELISGSSGGDGADSLTGTMGHDVLSGGNGNDTILSLAGDDRLDGGTGADLMNGGPGSDVYMVDDLGDRVIESYRWDGIDLVNSTVDFWLNGTHVETLTLLGDDDIRGVGNPLENVITGNSGDNILDGGKRNDTLIGGDGDDIYFIRAPGDTAIEEADSGIDTVKAYRSHKLAANIENLYLKSANDFNGIGNELDNSIVGTHGNNMLIGREGNDTLRGQLGDDTFVFDRMPGVGNVDHITDFNTNTVGEGDMLKILSSVFGGDLSAGALSADQFVTGTAALEADDRFIFDQGSGQLWFDADGSGAGAQDLIATFGNNATVTADHFIIV